MAQAGAIVPARPRDFAVVCGLALWAAAIAVAPTLTARLVLAAPAVLIPFCWWTLYRPARWIAVFFAAALLLPPLPIPIGDAGPHPGLFVAALGAFAGLLWFHRWNLAATPLNRALLALFGILLASVSAAAYNSGLEAAAGSLARVFLFGIGIYVFFYTAYGPAATSAPRLRYLYWLAVASALFACVDFYFQFPAPAGYGPQFVWLDSGVFRRAQGIFYESSTLGNFCAFFLVMIAAAFARKPEGAFLSRPALVAGGLVFFAALVMSYSRGSLINVLVALSLLVWINRSRVRWGRVLPAFAAGLAAVTWIVWSVFPAFLEMYWLRISLSAEFFFTATEGVLSGRVASWRALLEWVSSNPWQTLVGIGYKTLPYSNYVGGPVIADNMYLSLLVETGILGFAALLWLCFAILRAAGRAARSADATRAFCGTWILCFWAGQMVQMLSGDLLTYWRVLPIYLWVLAIAVRP